MSDESKSKHKVFTYQTALRRTGNRAGDLSSAGKPSFRVASPPEFKGESGVWTPEDLLVAAVETCTMTTFISFAQRKDLPLVSYESSAEGKLEFNSGRFEFTEIVVRPHVRIGDGGLVDEALQILEESHHHCLIANSIKGRVILEPIVEA